MQIVFVTGASGVGKSSLVLNLKLKHRNNQNCVCLHFDSKGVPSVEEMTLLYGSPEKWQRSVCEQWVENIIKDYRDKELVILEGQVNINFIKAAFSRHGFTDYRIILIHCRADQMAHRLIENRKQPELVTDEMKNWLKILKRQAVKNNIEILDTTKLSEEETLTMFEEKLFKSNG